MQVTTKITVDMTRQNVGQRVNAVQGDGNTRLVEITLLSGGAPWTPPEGVEAAIAYMQPGGTKGLYNKLADGTAAISISGNVATIVLAPQMLTVSGTVQASLVFNDAQLNRLTTFPFSVCVASNPSAGAQKVEDYLRLQWLEDKLDEYLRKAADSGEFDGKPGDNGVTFTPSVSENGDLSWRNNGGLPNPQTVNIRGQQGDSTAATAAANAAKTSAANAETHSADAAASAAAAQAAVEAMGPEVNQIKNEIVELEHLILSIQGNIPGAEPLAEFSQMNPLVTKYMDEVTYDPTDYSSSAMLTYSYTETDYVKWHPSGYDVDLKDSGELHLADSVSHTMIPSVVGVNSLVNAIPDVVAHWWNSVDGNVKQSGTIKPTGQVRMIATTATNVRDIGGWVCDGGRVKYGKLFRGGLLDETDRPVLVDQLRIKHDLDLRSKADNDGATSSPLGNDVIYTVADNAVWYTLSGRDEEWSVILRTIFDAVSKNEPVIFHCAAGADRTGTVACILEAILGVSQSDIDKDFELTSFAISPNARRRIDDDWKNLIGEITAIPTGSTFRDKVVNWVGSLGFTNDDLNNFRKSMIDGSPADVVIEEIVTPPTETNLFDVSAAHLNCRIGSDGGIREGLNGSVVIDIDVTSINKLKIKGNFVVSSTYNYMGRMAYVLSDETSKVGSWFTFDSQWTHDLAPVKEAHPTLSKTRYWFVIKDGVTITADDCASIEITQVE